MAKKSSKGFLIRNTEDVVKEEKKTSEISLKTFTVNLEESQVFSVSLKPNQSITLAVDDKGSVYPECFKNAIEQKILK